MLKSYLWSALFAILLFPGGVHAQISDGVVRLAVSNDQGGPYADIGGQGSVLAARLAVEDFGGSVLSAKIEILDADNQNKPDIASAIAREWIDVRGVDAIFDGGASSTSLAIQQIVTDKKRLFFATGPATPDLSGKSCSPYGFAWVTSTYALAKGTGSAVVAQGGDSWFFITADYNFGYALEADTSAFVKAAGGKALGSVRTPLNTPDFASALLQAQASGAKVIGLANTGTDLTNSVKQATEFGITAHGQKVAALLATIAEVHALGLDLAQGLIFTDPFYWDRDDISRAFAKRFMERRNGRAPTSVQAGTYSAVTAYLKAVQVAGTDDADKVRVQLMKARFTDPLVHDGWIRSDQRLMKEMLLVQVKTPQESKYPWDYEKILSVIPAELAWNPLSESACPLAKK